MKENSRLVYRMVHGKEHIEAPAEEFVSEVRRRWDAVAKPLDGLGTFEEMIARMGGILKTAEPDVTRRRILVFCADNGIVEEGVSQSGREVTLAVARAMGRQASSVGKMAAVNGTEVLPIDVGIADADEIPGVLNCKVCRGTKNFLREPAMTKEEMYEAMQAGMDAAAACKRDGICLAGVGEMGIGNTTTSAAIAAALLSLPVEQAVGRGAGLDEAGLAKKRQVVQQALNRYGFMQQGDIKGEESEREQALLALQMLGGLDIAAMAGVMLGGAYYHLPVVLDGVISLAAALLAVRMAPQVRDFLFPSHAGREPATAALLDALAMEPVIFGNLALGEGTGAVMLFSLLDMAMALYRDGTTFGGMDINRYERFLS